MTTDPRKIETPFGPRLERRWAPLHILGISSFLTQSLNKPSELGWSHQIVNIEVPVGTMAVVPVPNLWSLGYGAMDPEHVDPADDNATLRWHPEDHNWGLGWVQANVVDVNSPDYSASPPVQTAQLRIELYLRDENADDPVVGALGYSLLFLGRALATRSTTTQGRQPNATGPDDVDAMKRIRWG